jgi:hypothetical protein
MTVRIDLGVPQIENNEPFIMVFNIENLSTDKGRFLGSSLHVLMRLMIFRIPEHTEEAIRAEVKKYGSLLEAKHKLEQLTTTAA